MEIDRGDSGHRRSEESINSLRCKYDDVAHEYTDSEVLSDEITYFLSARNNVSVVHKTGVKKYLNPLCVLNIRAIRFSQPNIAVYR